MKDIPVKPSVLLSICGLLLTSIPARCLGEVVHIDFDHDPTGAEIVTGAVVDTVYAAAYGITFTAERCPTCGSDPHVYASSNCRPGAVHSLPNSVTLYGDNACSPISEHLGVVRVTFARAASAVCVHAMAVRVVDYAIIRAFNDAGMEILSESSGSGTLEDLCVAQPGITSVTFSGFDLLDCWFDDLTATLQGATTSRSPSWGSLKLLYR